MNQKKQLQKEILALFEEEMDSEIPSADTDLIETGYLDSLRFVHLLALLEDKYDFVINIDDLEFEYFKSVVKIAEFISIRINERPKLYRAM